MSKEGVGTIKFMQKILGVRQLEKQPREWASVKLNAQEQHNPVNMLAELQYNKKTAENTIEQNVVMRFQNDDRIKRR